MKGGWRRWKPSQDGYILLGSFREVPIRAHWVLLVALLVAPFFGLGTLSLAAALLVLLHELGHAWMIRWRSLAVAGIDAHLFGGRCAYHDQWATEWDRALIAWGGVFVQVLVFIPSFIYVRLTGGPSGPLEPYLNQVLIIALGFNVLVIGVNLLPIRGLDGGTAWSIVPLAFSRWQQWRVKRGARPGKRKERKKPRKASHLRVVRDDDERLH